MAQIKVTPDSVIAVGGEIKRHNETTNSVLDTITTSINRLRGCDGWDSDAANAFFQKYDQLRERINRHRPIINHYGDHLNKAATDYRASDDYAKSQASSINISRPS